MDPKTDSETGPSFSAFEDPTSEQDLFSSGSHSQTEGGAPILLQLLEFKTHLQEVVEELHIRRNAEARFEDEISKLVLEKQELEWEKESLQHQIETMTKQHTKSLGTVKKMFQVRLQHTEEEKGKYQVSAELKDKEINNLKEELKSLQLLKYNLEKKSSELEQKLALQTRAKDNHLNQLAEVEKRFSALSKQCAMVKQAHDKLEQNVDEAMRINSKLTSACQKQEGIVVSLKKELEEVSNKLIKEKMKSFRHEKTQSPLGREQPVQELQQKLNMEIEINKKLREENVAERTEKQKLMSSMQHSQQLLLSQTQTVRRIEQELESQTAMFQALKQEHEVMRENRKAMEDKVAELTESCAASKTSWDKERATFLNQIKTEQSDLQAVREAFEDLQQKCSELTLQASCQPQQTGKQEMKGDGQSPLVPTRLFFSGSDGFRPEETLNDPNCSSELPDIDSLQHTVSSQAKFPDCLKDTGAASKLAATGASGDHEKSNHQQQMIKQISGNSETAAETSDLIGLGESYLSKSVCISVSNPGCGSLNGSKELLDYETNEEKNRGKNEKDQGGEDNQQETNNMEQEKKVDVKSGTNAEAKRTIPVQTAERTDVHRGTEGSATQKTSNPETRDREGEVTDGVKERGQTAENASGTLEAQIPALLTADMTEASLTVQVNDFMDTELLSTVCEPLNSTESVSEKVTEDGNLNNGFTANTEEHKVTSDEHADVPHSLPAAAHTSCPESEPINNQSIPLCQTPEDENPPRESSGAFTAERSEILKQLHTCTSPTNAGEFQQNDNVEECQTNQTETERCSPSHVNTNMIQTDENTDAHVSKESELMRDPPQEVSAKESVQLTSAVANGEEDAQKREESQPNVNTRETAHIPSSTSSLRVVSMEAILLPDVSTRNIQEHAKTGTRKDVGDKEQSENRGDWKLSVLLSHDNDESSEIDRSQLHQKAPKEKRPNASFGLSLMRKNTSRSLFDWGTTQRKTFSSRPKSDGSVLQQLNQETDMSGPDTAGCSLSTMPMFIETRQSKGLVTGASDLSSATSVSGAAAYLTSRQKESREVKDETCRAAAAETRTSLSLGFFPVIPSSNTSSKGSGPNNLDRSKAPSPTSVPGSESDWEPLCSQVRETQQSSLRAQISKIEQFLNSERPRLPKRRRTDN